MKKILAACAMLLFVNAAGVAEDAPKPTVEPTVRVELRDGHGSGVYIGGGYVATAAHVVEDEVFADVVLADGKKVSAKVVMYDVIDDVALLRMKAPEGLRSAALACRAPVVGETVEVRGNPLDFEFVSTWGRVSGLPRQVGPWRLATVVDATIAPGNSGGPMFDADGKVLGLTVGVPMWEGTPFMFSLAIPSTTLCALRDALGLNV